MEKTTIEVLGAFALLCGAYIKFKGAFTVAIQEAMQPVIASVDKLSLVVEMLRDDMKTQRETLHDLELKVQEHETNIENIYRKTKTLETYYLEKKKGENR